MDENDSRTDLGTLYTATGTIDEDGKNARLTITPIYLVNEFVLGQGLPKRQMGGAGESAAVASESTMTAVLQSIRPEPLMSISRSIKHVLRGGILPRTDQAKFTTVRFSGGQL